jgi:hypothetical protein
VGITVPLKVENNSLPSFLSTSTFIEIRFSAACWATSGFENVSASSRLHPPHQEA